MEYKRMADPLSSPALFLKMPKQQLDKKAVFTLLINSCELYVSLLTFKHLSGVTTRS